MANMNAWLKSMEDKWAESAAVAKESSGQFERHPDGRYTCRTTGAELTESSNGRPQVAWVNTIIVGDLEGESLYSYDGLDGERSFEFLARKLARYGYDPETFKIRQLPRILAEIAEKKPVVKVRAKTNGEFQNVYLQKVMEDDYDPDEDDDAVSSRVVDEDDEPAPAATSRRARAVAPAPEPVAEPTRRPRRVAPVPEPEPEDDEDEEEEEEVAPAPVRRRAVAPAPTVAAKPPRTAAVAVVSLPPERPTRRAAAVAAPEPEDDDEDEDDGDEELQIGMKVSFKRRGVETEGIVTEIDEENETVSVKVGTKVYPIDSAEIEIIPEG